MPLKIPQSKYFLIMCNKNDSAIAVINHRAIALFIELWTRSVERCRSMDIILPFYSYGWNKTIFVFCFMASQLFLFFSVACLNSQFLAIIVTQMYICIHFMALSCRLRENMWSWKWPFTRHSLKFIDHKTKALWMPFKSSFIILPRPHRTTFVNWNINYSDLYSANARIHNSDHRRHSGLLLTFGFSILILIYFLVVLLPHGEQLEPIGNMSRLLRIMTFDMATPFRNICPRACIVFSLTPAPWN